MDRKPTTPRGTVFHRLMVCVSCAALLAGTNPEPLRAQTPLVAEQAESQGFSVEQLDALLAPIALFPDELLAQILMASTYPLQVVEAARWSDDAANRALTGDALKSALVKVSWDPSVKSLVPFPQVLGMLNGNLDWMQQIGYAMTVQQKAVMDSIQRLRWQARTAGQLDTTPQQVVRIEGQTVVIVPAQPDVVFVPSYNPATVFGAWPYPSYPPVFLPPPPGYAVGAALATGLAFGAGVAITAGLWGWARPNWGGGNVNVNVNRFNNINVNRTQINNSNWRPSGAVNRPGGGGFRPPSGPVGAPARAGGLPANGIGRPSVSAPGGIVRPPSGMGPGNRPAINPGGPNRPGTGQVGNNTGNRAPGGQGIGQGNRPGADSRPGQAARPATRPSAGQVGARAPAAFSGMGDGRNAAQFGNRGAQSRQTNASPRGGGGGAHAGAAARGGGAQAGAAARAGGGGGGGRGRGR